MARPTRARQSTRKKRDPQGQLTYPALAELFRREGPSQQVAGTSGYTLDHLRRFFRRRLPESSTILDYVRRRQQEGGSIRTITAELWSLAWMFQCAVQRGKLKQEDFPKIEFLHDDAAPAPPRPNLRRERWFSRIKPPEQAAPASTSPAESSARRNYLEEPFGPDGVIPVDTLRELAVRFKSESPQKLAARLNDKFPGLNATRYVVGRALNPETHRRSSRAKAPLQP